MGYGEGRYPDRSVKYGYRTGKIPLSNGHFF
ncbi:hypothetical protein SAMN04489764_1946 [Thermostaphylospora chromogena]|uniref:Uncharacterized protein n=1 Tax=Thermostaphylospora chromogena TaxID=35622 RepID=A0A1H1DCV4_9ACTN|nr:hypothetical protein SAMN04489764_1946 [Thermostaphylospora chromogena]